MLQNVLLREETRELVHHVRSQRSALHVHCLRAQRFRQEVVVFELAAQVRRDLLAFRRLRAPISALHLQHTSG